MHKPLLAVTKSIIILTASKDGGGHCVVGKFDVVTIIKCYRR